VTAAVVVAAVAAVPPTLAAVLTFAAARASDRRAAAERAAAVDQSLDGLHSSVERVGDAVGRVEGVVTDLRERVARLEGAQAAARSA
jgi:phage shock protein A